MRTKQRRAQQQRRVELVRNSIIGSVLIVIAAVVGYGLLYSTGVTDSAEFVEGEHYRLIEGAPRRRADQPIVVTEFFSYACVHCRNFQSLLDDWRQDLPEDVRFERSPVSFNANLAMLAQAYFALEEADALDPNHERIFTAIHDNGLRFLSVDQVADFVSGRSIDRQAFLDAYNSREIRRMRSKQEDRQRRLAIASTPTLVVADRYAVTMDGGRRQALQVVDHLIELERGADSQQPAP